MDIIRAIEQQQFKQDLPDFHVGDNVKVHYRITEGNRERIQVFQGDYFILDGILEKPRLASSGIGHSVIRGSGLLLPTG